MEGLLFFIILAAASAAIAGLLFGYDTAVINGALVYFRTEFQLGSVETEMVATVLLWGCARVRPSPVGPVTASADAWCFSLPESCFAFRGRRGVSRAPLATAGGTRAGWARHWVRLFDSAAVHR